MLPLDVLVDLHRTWMGHLPGHLLRKPLFGGLTPVDDEGGHNRGPAVPTMVKQPKKNTAAATAADTTVLGLAARRVIGGESPEQCRDAGDDHA